MSRVRVVAAQARRRMDVRRTWRRSWAGLVTRLRPEMPIIVRLVVAAILAYLAAEVVHPGNRDLTPPLTALLVVQANLYKTLRSGVTRVLAVLLGVGVAVVLSSWVGLSWWSLGTAIGTALVLAVVLGLENDKLEVPISAMLILGVTQHDTAAEVRLVNTLIGTAVGMAFTVLVPPPVRLRDAETAVREVAAAASDAVRRAGEEVLDGLTRERVERWIAQVHAILPLVSEADLALTEADDSRRLNPRAVTSINLVPVLREGLTSLDRALLAIRQVYLSLAAETPEDSPHRPTLASEGSEEELRAVFSVVLYDMADCLDAFGRLVVAQATGEASEAEDRLAEALEVLRETRARLTELAFIDPGEHSSTWLIRGSLLAGVERVLHELDVEDYALDRRRLVAEATKRAQRRAAIVNPWGIRVIDPLAEFKDNHPAQGHRPQKGRPRPFDPFHPHLRR